MKVPILNLHLAVLAIDPGPAATARKDNFLCDEKKVSTPLNTQDFLQTHREQGLKNKDYA